MTAGAVVVVFISLVDVDAADSYFPPVPEVALLLVEDCCSLADYYGQIVCLNLSFFNSRESGQIFSILLSQNLTLGDWLLYRI